MNLKFVISHLDQQMGPFSEDQLKEKWQKGDFLPIDYVYDEIKQDWVLLVDRFLWARDRGEKTEPSFNREVTQKHSVTEFPPPPPAATKTNPTPVTLPNVPRQIDQQINLVGGVGEIDLSPLSPGHVELLLQDTSPAALKLQQPLKIHVRPAEPHFIEWKVPSTQTAGLDAEIEIEALDQSGHLCAHYNDDFHIRISASSREELPVQLRNGKATLRYNHVKAETCKLSFHYSGERTLRLPEDKALEWQPGPAAKLILEGPKEYVAGHPLKVQVRAVDAYGNLAKTFQGTVRLEVKAS